MPKKKAKEEEVVVTVTELPEDGVIEVTTEEVKETPKKPVKKAKKAPKKVETPLFIEGQRVLRQIPVGIKTSFLTEKGVTFTLSDEEIKTYVK